MVSDKEVMKKLENIENKIEESKEIGLKEIFLVFFSTLVATTVTFAYSNDNFGIWDFFDVAFSVFVVTFIVGFIFLIGYLIIRLKLFKEYKFIFSIVLMLILLLIYHLLLEIFSKMLSLIIFSIFLSVIWLLAHIYEKKNEKGR